MNFFAMKTLLYATCVIVITAVCGAQRGYPPDIVTVPESHIYAKPGDNVTFYCFCSSDELIYYTQHKVCWNKIDDDRVRALTAGFYIARLDTSDYVKAQFKSGRFKLNHFFDALTDAFIFKIQGVDHSDGGIYQCVLQDGDKKELNSTTVELTVLNPVQKVDLEIHGPVSKDVLVKNIVQVSETDKVVKAVKLKPGNYTVKCTASDSSPAATMVFKFGDDNIDITLNSSKDTSDYRTRFKTWFSLPSFELKSRAMDRLITCSAKISRGNYPYKTAKIRVAEFIEPVVCSNTSSRLGDLNARILCNITSLGVICDNVKWIFGDDNHMIGPSERWEDRDDVPSIIQTSCQSINNGTGLEVSLEVWNIKDIHFQTIFYLSYSIGSELHQFPVQLMEIYDTTDMDKDAVDDNSVSSRIEVVIIVGVIVGAAAIGLVVAVVTVVLRRQRRHRSKPNNNNENTQAEDPAGTRENLQPETQYHIDDEDPRAKTHKGLQTGPRANTHEGLSEPRAKREEGFQREPQDDTYEIVDTEEKQVNDSNIILDYEEPRTNTYEGLQAERQDHTYGTMKTEDPRANTYEGLQIELRGKEAQYSELGQIKGGDEHVYTNTQL